MVWIVSYGSRLEQYHAFNMTKNEKNFKRMNELKCMYAPINVYPVLPKMYERKRGKEIDTRQI